MTYCTISLVPLVVGYNKNILFVVREKQND